MLLACQPAPCAKQADPRTSRAQPNCREANGIPGAVGHSDWARDCRRINATRAVGFGKGTANARNGGEELGDPLLRMKPKGPPSRPATQPMPFLGFLLTASVWSKDQNSLPRRRLKRRLFPNQRGAQRPFEKVHLKENRDLARAEGKGRRRCQALPFLFILFSGFMQESDEHHGGADPRLSAMHPPRRLGHGEAAGGARPRPRPPAARPRRPGSAPPAPGPCARAPAPGRQPRMGPAPPRCAPGVR